MDDAAQRVLHDLRTGVCSPAHFKALTLLGVELDAGVQPHLDAFLACSAMAIFRDHDGPKNMCRWYKTHGLLTSNPCVAAAMAAVLRQLCAPTPRLRADMATVCALAYLLQMGHTQVSAHNPAVIRFLYYRLDVVAAFAALVVDHVVPAILAGAEHAHAAEFSV